MKKLVLVLIIAMFFFGANAFAKENPDNRIKLLVFYSPGCHRCIHAKQDILPGIEKKYKGVLSLEYRNITEIENYKFLLSLQRMHNDKTPIELPFFYCAGRFVNGIGDVKGNLESLIAFSLKEPLHAGEVNSIDLMQTFLSFKPLAITGAGLTDGINPCAFTVIVFFISFLALQGYRKKELMAIGLVFIFAVFLTYLALGLGIFNFLYSLNGFWIIAKTLNIGIGIFSIFLGLCAVYDFIKFKRTGKTEGLLLQLPEALKRQVHKVIGMHYRKNKNNEDELAKPSMLRLTASAFTTGFLVSLLEAVCTGQLYIPTITFVLKTTHLKWQAFGYLALYNIMFVVPLFIIFLFALFGTTSEQFSDFLKKRLLLIKVLMASVFFALGAFLIWRA